jgi:hypothetical protein
VAALVGLGAIGTVVGFYVWLSGYQPLGVAGSYIVAAGPGHMVDPPLGSDGTEVFFPRYRRRGSFQASTTLANHAPFAITVVGLGADPDPDPFRAVRLDVARRDYDTRDAVPVDSRHPLRLAPGQDRTLTLTYRIVSRCLGGQPAGYWKSDARGASDSGFRSAWFRIRYEHLFEKTQRVELPFAITLVCRNGVTAPPAG